MKSGAGDDPFADDAGDDQPDEETEAIDRGERERRDADGREVETTDDSGSHADDGPEQSGREPRRLPYKYRRDGVKDGRTQRPMFLQDGTQTRIREEVSAMEDQFPDETVYKTDVVEAMLVAAADDRTTAAVLREWGYGWD